MLTEILTERDLSNMVDQLAQERGLTLTRYNFKGFQSIASIVAMMTHLVTTH